MKKLFQYWCFYFLFIRLIYRNSKRKKWKKFSKSYDGYNESIYTLAWSGIGLPPFFLFVLFEYLFRYKGFIYIASKRIPSIVPTFIIVVCFFFLIFLFKKILAKKLLTRTQKYSIIRKEINRTRKIKIIYPISYIIFAFLLFFTSVFITILAAHNNIY